MFRLYSQTHSEDISSLHDPLDAFAAYPLHSLG